MAKLSAILKFRKGEHLGVSTLTGKRVRGDNDSAIKEYHLSCNHLSSFALHENCSNAAQK